MPDVPTLASNLCGLAVGSAEMLLSFSFPRVGDLVEHFYGFTDEEAFQDFWQGSLDPRCGSALSPI